jgi:hypothetical protein
MQRTKCKQVGGIFKFLFQRLGRGKKILFVSNIFAEHAYLFFVWGYTFIYKSIPFKAMAVKKFNANW